MLTGTVLVLFQKLVLKLNFKNVSLSKKEEKGCEKNYWGVTKNFQHL